ncbi:predicted protein [Lichtheimia corymbifera JMRC:FSU:9682]|uniref:Uncharacterized protein n=1 Tax=Lichtheimia corymbifera JMRC:FSU:9682 TaxID=1263082 RepID=A0A068SE28_9FUNG|nr:predicted protein [Lichtheimia corymbifera JMRC:FSU:9682]
MSYPFVKHLQKLVSAPWFTSGAEVDMVQIAKSYPHVYLNAIQIRISPRWRVQLAFAVHPSSTVIAHPLLHNHVIPHMQAARNLERFCVWTLH